MVIMNKITSTWKTTDEALRAHSHLAFSFVLTGSGAIVEIQATGEKRGFSQDEFEALFSLARKGIGELVTLQKAATAK